MSGDVAKSAKGRSRKSVRSSSKTPGKVKRTSKARSRSKSRKMKRKRSSSKKKKTNKGLFGCCGGKKKKKSTKKKGKSGKKKSRSSKSKSRKGKSKSKRSMRMKPGPLAKSVKSTKEKAVIKAPPPEKPSSDTTKPTETLPSAPIMATVPTAQSVPTMTTPTSLPPTDGTETTAPTASDSGATAIGATPESPKTKEKKKDKDMKKTESTDETKDGEPKKKLSGMGIEEDDGIYKTKDVQYPSQKFFLTQYVENGCRIRRWNYEDSVPITMNSNMKFMLQMAKAKISDCKDDKQNRAALCRDLNELSAILEKN